MNENRNFINCFLCSAKILAVQSSKLTPDESSALYHLFEFPKEDSYFGRLIFTDVDYCSICSRKVVDVRKSLDELEKLESKILRLKLGIESSLRKSNREPQGSESQIELFRSEIIEEIGSLKMLKSLERLNQRRQSKPSDIPVTPERSKSQSRQSPTYIPENVSTDSPSSSAHVEEVEDDKSWSHLQNISTTTTTNPGDVNEFSASANSEDQNQNAVEYDPQVAVLKLERIFPEEENETTVETPAFIQVKNMANLMEMETAEAFGGVDDIEGTGTAVIGHFSSERVVIQNVRHRGRSLSNLGKKKVPATTMIRLKDGRPGFKCGFCPAVLLTRNYLKRHEALQHLGQPTSTCTICGAGFAAPSNLKNHIDFKHSSDRNFQCDQCNCAYKTKYHLNRHISKNHSQPVHLDQIL